MSKDISRHAINQSVNSYQIASGSVSTMRQCIFQKVSQWLVTALELFQQQLLRVSDGRKRHNDRSILNGPVCVCVRRCGVQLKVWKEKLVSQGGIESVTMCSAVLLDVCSTEPTPNPQPFFYTVVHPIHARWWWGRDAQKADSSALNRLVVEPRKRPCDWLERRWAHNCDLYYSKTAIYRPYK